MLKTIALASSLAISAATAQDVRLLAGPADGPPIEENSSTVALGVSDSGQFVLLSTLDVFDLSDDSAVSAAVLPTGSTATSGVAGSISENGRRVTWQERISDDDIFLHDLDTGITINITEGADGVSGPPRITADGRYVSFVSVARNLADNPIGLGPSGRGTVLRYDSETGIIDAISLTSTGQGLDQGLLSVNDFDVSRDGRHVFYGTTSSNAHPDRQSSGSALSWQYRRTLSSGVVQIVNRDSDGNISNAGFTLPRASFDGNRVVFLGANVGLQGEPMVEGYENFFGTDLYVKDFTSQQALRVTTTLSGDAPDGAIGSAALGGDGDFVVFASSSTNHIAEETDPQGTGTTDGSFDVFRTDITASGVALTWLSQPPDGTNVNVFSATVFAPVQGDYGAFNTNQWEAMLTGSNEIQTFDSVIGVGEFNFVDFTVFKSGFEGGPSRR